jgi:type VI secretion system Hcp family effector
MAFHKTRFAKGASHMAATHLIKVEGIPGESQFEGFTDHSPVDNWRVSVTNTGTSDSIGGGTGGTVSAGPLIVTMKTHKGSPKMLEAAASGKHIKTVKLVSLKSTGSKPFAYHTVTLTDAVISMHSMGSALPAPGSQGSKGSDELNSDEIHFTYSKISSEYKGQTSEGAAGPGTEGGFDLKSHKAGK